MASSCGPPPKPRSIMPSCEFILVIIVFAMVVERVGTRRSSSLDERGKTDDRGTQSLERLRARELFSRTGSLCNTCRNPLYLSGMEKIAPTRSELSGLRVRDRSCAADWRSERFCHITPARCRVSWVNAREVALSVPGRRREANVLCIGRCSLSSALASCGFAVNNRPRVPPPATRPRRDRAAFVHMLSRAAMALRPAPGMAFVSQRSEKRVPFACELSDSQAGSDPFSRFCSQKEAVHNPPYQTP